ncbi:hypothetical protein DFH27DRAFT_617085 [Peziza echinospora]|nr:hypothetical protein DFH27DRAFT_617085 [Peziza echinospora]
MLEGRQAGGWTVGLVGARREQSQSEGRLKKWTVGEKCKSAEMQSVIHQSTWESACAKTLTHHQQYPRPQHPRPQTSILSRPVDGLQPLNAKQRLLHQTAIELLQATETGMDDNGKIKQPRRVHFVRGKGIIDYASLRRQTEAAMAEQETAALRALLQIIGAVYKCGLAVSPDSLNDNRDESDSDNDREIEGETIIPWRLTSPSRLKPSCSLVHAVLCLHSAASAKMASCITFALAAFPSHGGWHTPGSSQQPSRPTSNAHSVYSLSDDASAVSGDYYGADCCHIFAHALATPVIRLPFMRLLAIYAGPARVRAVEQRVGRSLARIDTPANGLMLAPTVHVLFRAGRVALLPRLNLAMTTLSGVESAYGYNTSVQPARRQYVHDQSTADFVRLIRLDRESRDDPAVNMRPFICD